MYIYFVLKAHFGAANVQPVSLVEGRALVRALVGNAKSLLSVLLTCHCPPASGLHSIYSPVRRNL